MVNEIMAQKKVNDRRGRSAIDRTSSGYYKSLKSYIG